jgi:hypothetical protein
MAGVLCALAGLSALGVSVDGCELAVTDTLPQFSCVPGATDVCPAGQVCDPVAHRCGRPGSVTATPEAGLETDATAGDDGSDRDGGGDDHGGVDQTASDGAVTDRDTSVDAPVSVIDAGAPDGGPCTGFGCSCSSSPSCASGICASLQEVTEPVFAKNGAFCAKPCCTSWDCPDGVCFATGEGGNYCVPPAWLPDRSTTGLGEGYGGATCTTNSDCRSGLCASGACADTCCSASAADVGSECATGSSCRIGTFPGTGFDNHAAAYCTSGLGGCTGSGCTACRNSTECGTGKACYYQAPVLGSSNIVAACTAIEQQNSPVGTKCTGDFNCATNFCETTYTNECSDVCFSDADCSAVPDWYCRPEQIMLITGGTDAVLVCGPPIP